MELIPSPLTDGGLGGRSGEGHVDRCAPTERSARWVRIILKSKSRPRWLRRASSAFATYLRLVRGQLTWFRRFFWQWILRETPCRILSDPIAASKKAVKIECISECLYG